MTRMPFHPYYLRVAEELAQAAALAERLDVLTAECAVLQDTRG